MSRPPRTEPSLAGVGGAWPALRGADPWVGDRRGTWGGGRHRAHLLVHATARVQGLAPASERWTGRGQGHDDERCRPGTDHPRCHSTRSGEIQPLAQHSCGACAGSPIGAHVEAPVPRPSRRRPHSASSRAANGARAHGGGTREAAEVCDRLFPNAESLAALGRPCSTFIRGRPARQSCRRTDRLPPDRVRQLAAHRVERDAAASNGRHAAARRRSRSRARTVDASRISTGSPTYGSSPTSTKSSAGIQRCEHSSTTNSMGRLRRARRGVRIRSDSRSLVSSA